MNKPSWLSHALIAASSAALAVVCVLGTAGNAPPSSLRAAQEASSAAVVLTEYRDERTVAAEIEATQPVETTLGLSGTVTSSTCVAGGGIESGHVVASLNGRPVLGLHAAVPFYRDIGPGTAGADVDALRTQLGTMGLAVQDKGAYSADLAMAIFKIQTDLALNNRDGILHLDETLWLPSVTVRVKSCDALLGSRYVPGAPFITIVGVVSSLRVVFPPGQPPTAGPRTVTFGNVSAPVTDEGMVTDPTLLAEVSRSPEFAESQTGSSSKPLSVTTSLSSPLEVAKVPVSGVFGVQKDNACVKAVDGSTSHITIAGSSAGAVLARFEKDVPKEILLGASVGDKRCP